MADNNVKEIEDLILTSGNVNWPRIENQNWPATADFFYKMDYKIVVDETSLPKHVQCPSSLFYRTEGTNIGNNIHDVHIVCSGSGKKIIFYKY